MAGDVHHIDKAGQDGVLELRIAVNLAPDVEAGEVREEGARDRAGVEVVQVEADVEGLVVGEGEHAGGLILTPFIFEAGAEVR